MKRNIYGIIIILVILFGLTTLISRSFRVSQIPNGSSNSCANCHVSPSGGGERNLFGQLVEEKFLSQAGAAGNVEWGPLLASLDADNDGVTNGEELQDPYGTWEAGEPAPGNSDLVSLPGNPNAAHLQTLTLSFESMNPHLNQLLEVRVFDRTNQEEAGIIRDTIETADFDLQMPVLKTGHSYFVDFYADLNGNGVYDSPPEDHAWRLELSEAEGNDTLNFTHNTNFTDINWKYKVDINFSSMDPHVGQLLEVRVEDDMTSEEVGRTRIETISETSFTVSIPGIELGKEYNIEMYADLNENGVYDSPPADHAWELDFTSDNGNEVVNFTHNTNFTDIGWKYLYTMNFIDMNPHVGQMLQLRVVNQDNDEEVGRVTIDSIPAPMFKVSIPQIEMDHDYRVDFYADFNMNGEYDAPSDDHAWRVAFNSTTGNYVDNFTHNTDFTDIQWPDVTSVDEGEKIIPGKFKLAQNYPNPFNPSTKITFNLPNPENVTLKVYNQTGEEVRTLIDNRMMTGTNTVNFNGSNLASGVYFYRISAGQLVEVRKMMLLK